MIRESEAFGSRLRTERLRRGISLDSISEKTKIQKAFLEGLERGDLSKWPAGEVFRRAYIRDYASTVGLSPDAVFADFVRLVQGGDEPSGARHVPRGAEAPLVMIFDTAPTWRHRLTGSDARAAAMDLAGLCVLGSLLALITGASVWTASGILALLYFPATAVLWGRSVASRFLDARRVRRPAPLVPAAPFVPDGLKPGATSVPEHSVLGRLEAVVDPLLLTISDGPRSGPVSQETTTH